MADPMRSARRYFLTAIAAAACECLCAGQVTYDLSKVPAFGVGDRVTCSLTGRGGSAIVAQEGKLLQNERRSRSEEIVQEVLAVDSRGRVTSFRATISAATETTSSTHPAQAAFRKMVKLRNIFATVGWQDGLYVTDTTSVAGEPPTLTASRIALLKKILLASTRFRAYDPNDACLLPGKPVAVGQTWTPAPGALDRWARDHPTTRRMRATVSGAQFALAAVDGQYASLRGTIRLRASLGGRAVEPVMQLAFSLHMPSGRWLAQSVSVQVEALLRGAKLVVEGRRMCAMAYTPGRGVASAAPKGSSKLGWPAPGKDTNSFRSAQHGISLDVPPAYRPRMPAGGDMVAAFASQAGGHLAVSLRQMPQPVDMEEVLPKVLANLKKTVRQFELQQTRPLSLPGNVPAALLVGRGMAGRAAVIRLVAIDDKRVVSVAAAAGADKPQIAADLLRIVRTLRTFPPTPEREKPAGQGP